MQKILILCECRVLLFCVVSDTSLGREYKANMKDSQRVMPTAGHMKTIDIICDYRGCCETYVTERLFSAPFAK